MRPTCPRRSEGRPPALATGAAAVVAVLVGLVAWLAGAGLLGLALGVLLGAALALAAWFRSVAVALSLAKAAPADVERFARLHNLVDGLCAAGGLPKPALYVVADAAPDAFAVGPGPR